MYLPNMWPHPGMMPPAMPPAPPGMQVPPMGFRPADFASYTGYLVYPPPYGMPFGYPNAPHLPPMMAPWSMAPAGITSYGPFMAAGPAAGTAAGDDDEDDDDSSSDDSSDMDDGNDSSSDDIDPWATAAAHSKKARRLDDASTSNCSGSSIRSDEELQQGQQEEVQQPAWRRAKFAKPAAQHASRLPAFKQATLRSTALPKPAVPAAKAATKRGQLSLADVLLQVAQEEEDAGAGRHDADDIWPGLCSWGSGNKRK